MSLTVLLAGFRLPLPATKRFLSTASDLLILLVLPLTSLQTLVSSTLYFTTSLTLPLRSFISSFCHSFTFNTFSSSVTLLRQFSATLLLLQHFASSATRLLFSSFSSWSPPCFLSVHSFQSLLFFDFFDFFDDSLRCLSSILVTRLQTSLLSHSFTSATKPLMDTLYLNNHFSPLWSTLYLDFDSSCSLNPLFDLVYSPHPLLYLSTNLTLFQPLIPCFLSFRFCISRCARRFCFGLSFSGIFHLIFVSPF